MDRRAWEQREEERKEGRIFLLLRVLVRDQCSPVVGSSRVESSAVQRDLGQTRLDQIQGQWVKRVQRVEGERGQHLQQ